MPTWRVRHLWACDEVQDVGTVRMKRIKKRTRHGCLLVGVVAAVLYVNSLGGEFVFDDHEAIENNPDVRSNTPLYDVFQNDFWGQQLSSPESHKSFRPLTTLTFRLNRVLHGMWPPGFHLFNILSHSLVSSLFYLLCQKLELSKFTSLVCSLLFAAHPIHTEAVANIVGRTELLSAIFFLLALLSYHRCLKHGYRTDSSRQYSKYHKEIANTNEREIPIGFSIPWLLCSILLGAVSMLYKEQGITVLGVCISYDLFVASGKDLWEFCASFRQAVMSRNEGEVSMKRELLWFKSFLIRVLLLIVSAVVLLSFRFYLNGGGSPLFVESDNPASFSPHFATRFLTYVHLIVLNLWLLLCPSRLCFDWSMGSIPLVESAGDSRNMWSAVVTVVTIVFIIAVGLTSSASCYHGSSGETVGVGNSEEQCKSTVKQKRPRVVEGHCSKHQSMDYRLKCVSLFALSLLVIPFLPASNLLFPVGFVIAERVLYLPSLGLCLLVAVGIEKLHQSKSGRGLKKVLLLSAATAVVLVYSVKTVGRNWEWDNALSLAESAVPVNPSNAKVFATIANHYAQNGNRRCELFYRQALLLRPNYTAAWTNLGLVLLNTDRPKEAESCYRKALSIKEDHINANTNMAHLCRLQGRWSEAVRHYSTVLRRRPRNPLLHYYLGYVHQQVDSDSDRQSAIQEYGLAVEQHPGHWESQLALGRLLSTTTSAGTVIRRGYSKGKRLDKAIEHYQWAVRIKQDNAEAHFELGKLLLWKGSPLEAKEQFSIVLHLTPNDAGAHLELGNTLEQLGDREGAVREWEKAWQLDPHLQLAQQKLQEVRKSV